MKFEGIYQYKAFTINNNCRNIVLKLNGYTISMGISDIHYCENRFKNDAGVNCDKTSDNVELGIFDKDEKWATKEIWEEVFGEIPSDDVEGWVTMEQMTKIIAHIAAK